MSLPPVFSCRSGLPVLLNAVTKQGPPAPKPFKLHITRKETDLTEMNVIQFQELPMDQVCAGARKVPCGSWCSPKHLSEHQLYRAVWTSTWYSIWGGWDDPSSGFCQPPRGH
jgi:hypothetical protein